MFETGTYKSLPEHVALYEALEASMERAPRDEFLCEKDKSRSSQPPAPQLSAWKTTDTREAPSSSPKQQSAEAGNGLEAIPRGRQTCETQEPDGLFLQRWTLLETNDNWANVLANSYKDPEENKLLRKTSDMGSFCR
ncbi:hypothetical protein Tco_0399769 [Tanacetum coccineum]